MIRDRPTKRRLSEVMVRVVSKRLTALSLNSNPGFSAASSGFGMHSLIAPTMYDHLELYAVITIWDLGKQYVTVIIRYEWVM